MPWAQNSEQLSNPGLKTVNKTTKEQIYMK